MERPLFSVNVHAPILKAGAHERGALTLEFGGYPHINIFTSDVDLATKMAAAINAVIAEHSTLNRAQQGIGSAA